MDLDCRVKETNAGFEMRCYQRLLNSTYKDHVTNEEVRRNFQAAIGEHDEHLTLVKKEAEVVWLLISVFWISKENPTGTMKVKRRGGRQKKRWEDNNKEWTGLDFASLIRTAENRTR